jgi:hypothetical protein
MIHYLTLNLTDEEEAAILRGIRERWKSKAPTDETTAVRSWIQNVVTVHVMREVKHYGPKRRKR